MTIQMEWVTLNLATLRLPVLHAKMKRSELHTHLHDYDLLPLGNNPNFFFLTHVFATMVILFCAYCILRLLYPDTPEMLDSVT
jgi:hypothetical protein